MKIQQQLKNILEEAPCLGTFDLDGLLQFTAAHAVSGFAMATGDEKEYYIGFVAGEPEGAIYVDEKGTLFGDKAVILIDKKAKFTLCDIKREALDLLVAGCRIYDKTHLKTTSGNLLAEFGKKGSVLGLLSLRLVKGGVPQNGIRISIRKEGKIVGSDITTGEGSVGFKAAYGVYDCIVQERSQTIKTYQITFDNSHTNMILEL